jgi:predicted RNase H-like HicB family nuclease
MATYLEYLNTAVKKAEYERMADGRYFASIPQFDGLWAVGRDRAEAEQDLRGALDSWLDVHIKIGQQRPPRIDGVDFFDPPKAIE